MKTKFNPGTSGLAQNFTSRLESNEKLEALKVLKAVEVEKCQKNQY